MAKYFKLIVCWGVVCFSALSGCGVRGRPQPPETPPEIGRGQPTFRRATEQFRYQNVPPVRSEPDDRDRDDRDADDNRNEEDEG